MLRHIIGAASFSILSCLTLSPLQARPQIEQVALASHYAPGTIIISQSARSARSMSRGSVAQQDRAAVS